MIQTLQSSKSFKFAGTKNSDSTAKIGRESARLGGLIKDSSIIFCFASDELMLEAMTAAQLKCNEDLWLTSAEIEI